MEFDVNSFLDQTTTEASEARPPVPSGDYTSVIQDLTVTPWQSKDKYDPTTGELKSGIRFDIVHAVDLPPAVADASRLVKPTLTLTDRVMIDLKFDKTVDYTPGRNGRLRQYRDATGLNAPGQPFNPRMLIGKVLRVRITHEEYQGRMLEQIGAISKAA